MAISERAEVEVRINSKEAKEALQTLERQANRLKKELEDAIESKKDPKEIQRLQRELRSVNKEVRTIQKDTVSLNQVLQNLSSATPKELRATMQAITREMNSGHVARGSKEWRYYQEQLKRVNDEMKEMSREIVDVNKIISHLDTATPKELQAAMKELNRQLDSGVIKRGTVLWDSYQDMLRKCKTELESISRETVDVNRVMKNLKTASPKELQMALAEINRQLTDGSVRRGSAEWKHYKAQARAVKQELQEIDKEHVNISRVMKKLSSATPRQLRDTLAEINARLDSGEIERGSKRWKMYQQAVKRVNDELRTIQQETQDTKSWLDRFNDGFARWGTILATTTAALTGVSMAYNSFRTKRDDEEEARANLKSLTGLDDNSIAWLQQQAESLSTTMHESGLRVRQSAEEIIQAYMLVGSKKPELLANKEALNEVTIEAMRLAAAAGIDLKDAVQAVTVSLNMYSEDASQAAKYVNILAAGSQKGAAAVESQAEAITNAGVAAASAGVPMEALQGTIQMLAEKGIEGSVAGTALRKFFLVLQTGADETNPKVVGFEQALANLAAQGLTAADIQKKFGEEGYTAASVLLQNVDKVMAYTDAVTGTSVATDQAAINSDTAKARMAQYRNEMNRAGIELAQRLNPAFLQLTGLTKKIIVALPTLIDWVREYAAALTAAAVAFGVYAAAVNLAAIKTMLLDKWNKLAAISQAALNAVMSANPYHLAIAAGAALVTFLAAKFIPTTDKATESQKKLNNEMDKTISQEDRLLEIRKRHASMDKMNSRQQQQLKQDAETLLQEIEDQILAEETAAKKNYTVISFLVQKRKELEAIIASVPKASGTSSVPAAPADPKEAGKAEDAKHSQELSVLRQMYLDEQITREEYLRLVEDSELQHLQRMLAIAGMEPQERAKIQDQILQAKIKFKEQCLAEEQKEYEERRSTEIDSREQAFADEKEAITLNHYQNMTSEEAYREEMREAERNFLAEMLSDKKLSDEERQGYQRQYKKLEMQEAQEKYTEQKKKEKETEAMNRRYMNIARGVASEYGETLGNMIANGQLNMHNFLKETLKMSVDALEKVIEICVVEVIARNAASGFWGIAKAAAQIAAIKAAFAAVKGVVANFDVGGYTGDGRWDEPKGIVHAGEFVANRFAVGNPEVRPVLDLINTAQRNNTVGALTASDITSVLYGTGTGSGSPAEGGQTGAVLDPELHAVLVSLNRAANRLNVRLKDKMIGEVALEGKNGIHAAEKKFNKLQKNISRS